MYDKKLKLIYIYWLMSKPIKQIAQDIGDSEENIITAINSISKNTDTSEKLIDLLEDMEIIKRIFPPNIC